MKLVVLTASERDPVATALEGLPGVALAVISLQTFINHVAVDDVCDHQGSRIHWQHPSGTITNDETTWMLSRLTGTPSEPFDVFHKDDRDFAWAETMAYLGFAVNQFHLVNDYCTQHGGEMVHALPHQWECIRQSQGSDEAFRLPRYYWGDPKFLHLEGSELVYSAIFNFTWWRPNRAQHAAEAPWFVFERPQGLPVFCLTVGEQVCVTATDSCHGLDITPVRQHGLAMARLFQYVISEQLWFVSETGLTFGFITPLVNYSAKQPSFQSFIHDSFAQLGESRWQKAQ